MTAIPALPMSVFAPFQRRCVAALRQCVVWQCRSAPAMAYLFLLQVAWKRRTFAVCWAGRTAGELVQPHRNAGRTAGAGFQWVMRLRFSATLGQVAVPMKGEIPTVEFGGHAVEVVPDSVRALLLCRQLCALGLVKIAQPAQKPQRSAQYGVGGCVGCESDDFGAMLVRCFKAQSVDDGLDRYRRAELLPPIWSSRENNATVTA